MTTARDSSRGSQSRVALLLYAVATLVSGLVVFGGDGTAPYVAFDVAGAVAVVAILWGVRRFRPAGRGTWLLLAAATGAFTISFSVIHWWLFVLKRPFASGSWFELVGYPGFIVSYAWIWSVIRKQGRWRSNGDRFDLGLLVVGMCTPAYFIVLHPTISTPYMTTSGKASLLLYAIGDLVITALLVRLVFGGNRSMALRVLLGSYALATVADLSSMGMAVNAVAVDLTRYMTVAWWLAFVLIGLGALLPSMRTVAAPSSTRAVGLSRGRLVAVAAALLMPVVTAVLVRRLGREPSYTALLVPTAFLIVLLLARLRGLFTTSEQSRLAVAQQKEYFQSVAFSLSEAFAVTEADTTLRDIPHSFRTTFAKAEPGMPLAALGFDADRIRAIVAEAAIDPGTPVVEELEQDLERDGRRWFEVTVTDATDRPAVNGLIWVLRNVTERHRFTDELRRQAEHDALTGLPNRTLFANHLSSALERARRADRGVGVLFVDLDDFKSVNDTLGHEAGDELLVAVAGRLRNACRENDLVARLGGDEFAVVIEHGDLEGASATAARVLDVLDQPFGLQGQRVPVTASVGVAYGCPQDGDSLLREADMAMYSAKTSGKDTSALFDSAMRDAAVARFTAELERS